MLDVDVGGIFRVMAFIKWWFSLFTRGGVTSTVICCCEWLESFEWDAPCCRCWCSNVLIGDRLMGDDGAGEWDLGRLSIITLAPPWEPFEFGFRCDSDAFERSDVVDGLSSRCSGDTDRFRRTEISCWELLLELAPIWWCSGGVGGVEEGGGVAEAIDEAEEDCCWLDCKCAPDWFPWFAASHIFGDMGAIKSGDDVLVSANDSPSLLQRESTLRRLSFKSWKRLILSSSLYGPRLKVIIPVGETKKKEMSSLCVNWLAMTQCNRWNYSSSQFPFRFGFP